MAFAITGAVYPTVQRRNHDANHYAGARSGCIVLKESRQLLDAAQWTGRTVTEALSASTEAPPAHITTPLNRHALDLRIAPFNPPDLPFPLLGGALSRSPASSSRALFVDVHLADRSGLPPIQSALHRPPRSGANFVPT